MGRVNDRMTELQLKVDLFVTLSWSMGFEFAPDLPVIQGNKHQRPKKLLAWRNICKTWTTLSGCTSNGWKNFPQNLVEWNQFSSHMDEHYSAQVVLTVYSTVGAMYMQGFSLMFSDQESMDRFFLSWV